MKQIITPTILRKIFILSFLIVGLVFVVSTDKTTEPVFASECCENCPVPPGSLISIEDYCTSECGASSGSCYTYCRNRAYNCWSHCDMDCSGGGMGQRCGPTGYCPVGWVCYDGYNCADAN
jgi:hypothetical protein